MLSTVITYQEKQTIPPISTFPFIRVLDKTHYQIYLPSGDKVIGELSLSDEVLTITYSSELMLNEFMIIHDLITQLTNKHDCIVNDSNSFLGYLPDGESAYIMTNWTPWLGYIQQSMKYCQ